VDVSIKEPTGFTLARDSDGIQKPIEGDPFEVKVINPDGSEYPVTVQDGGDGEYKVVFTPP